MNSTGIVEFSQKIANFLNYTLLGVPVYKLIAAFLILVFSIFLRKVFILVIVKTIQRFTRKTKTKVDDLLVDIFSKPLSFFIIGAGLFFSFLLLGIKEVIVYKILKTLFIFVLTWVLYNSIINFEKYIYEFASKFGKEVSQEFGSFLVKLCKISVIGLGILTILQEWGINVSAIIASLGIGGLAFALAAKDTIANLFGGLTVLIDKSMKVGDWIKIGDVEGIVESIGLRTSKIRTFEKSLITIPNQMLANQSLENFSRRNVRRIKMFIGLTYSTSREQMINILKDIREMLRKHPGIAQNELQMVYFRDFGSSSLDIFFYCFTNTANWEEYLRIREDVNLKIMEIVEKHGASFAFPSSSIYIEKLPDDLPKLLKMGWKEFK